LSEMKYAQLVIGPAGSGKSSYCATMQQHFVSKKRVLHVVNLDPAADEITYEVSFDIRELIGLDDVVEELVLGPNGGLIFCMEYLIENIEWFQNKIGDFEDDYLIIDCPGQIELYSHIPVMPILIKQLEKMGYRICVLYLLDCNFIGDSSKFISGILSCLSAMTQLELPHINLLTKVDLLQNTNQLDPDQDEKKQKNNENNDDNENEEELDLSHLEEYFDPNIIQLIEKS